jgi:hypothetical protein
MKLKGSKPKIIDSYCSHARNKKNMQNIVLHLFWIRTNKIVLLIYDNGFDVFKMIQR